VAIEALGDEPVDVGAYDWVVLTMPSVRASSAAGCRGTRGTLLPWQRNGASVRRGEDPSRAS
jgi:hypothetical protein